MVFPLLSQLVSVREFTATHFNGDFKRVAMEVVVIFHTPRDVVPMSTVGDS